MKLFELYKGGEGVRLQCGDTFVEWDAENFLRSMEWLGREKAAQKELSELKEKLKEIEYITQYHYSSEATYDGCPACGNEKEQGHEVTCWLKSAIKEGKE